MFSSYKRVIWLATVMSLFVFVPFYVIGFSTDVWTRLARIQEWVNAGFPWKEQLMMSQNYPFGLEMHWTRPLDFIGYVFAWPFIPNWGLKEALEIMSCYVPILVMLLAVRGFFYGVRGYLTPKAAFFAFWLFFFNIGYAWGQSSVGYFDHHTFHFCILVWCIAFIARSFRIKDNAKYLIMAGCLSALGTWITPEFFINSYILIAPFLVYWLFYNRSLKPAMIYTTVYSVVLCAVMLFDHQLSGFWTLDLYRPSVFHVILGLGNLGLLGFLSIPTFRKTGLRRLIFGVLGASSLALIMLILFADVLLKPMVDPLQYHFWTKKVSEMRPLWEDWKGLMIYSILPILLSLGMLVWVFRRLKNNMAPLVLISVSGLLFYAIMMIFHIRVGISQQAFFIFLASCYFKLVFFPREKSFYCTFFFIVFCSLLLGTALKGSVIITRFKGWGTNYYLEKYKADNTIEVPDFLKEPFDKAVEDEKNDKENVKADKKEDTPEEDKSFSCRGTDTIWDFIKADKGTGAILTPIFEAPEVLWETGRPVLGGPYHLNTEGLSDLFAIQLDDKPFDRAYELLKKHQVELLFITNPKCQDSLFNDEKTKKPFEGVEDSFWHTVYYEKKDMPKWLKLEYHNYKTNIKIFRIVEPKTKKKTKK